jgi:hypothetical protein
MLAVCRRTGGGTGRSRSMSLHVCLAVLMQSTWVVDASHRPGTGFPDLPAAVAAAGHGDTILVRARPNATYSGFHVHGKALTIRGESPLATRVAAHGAPEVTIEAVPEGSVFCLQGLHLALPLTVRGGDLVIMDCSVSGGPALWVDRARAYAGRCQFLGGHQGLVHSGLVAREGVLLDAATLVCCDCTITGGDDSSYWRNGPAYGGVGLKAKASLAILFACSIVGGTGTTLQPPHAPIHRGADAVELNASFARISGTKDDVVQAGRGAPGRAVRAYHDKAGAVVHGPVSLLPSSPEYPPTLGPVELFAPPLPRLSVSGRSAPSGELVAGHALTVTLVGALPRAPVLLGYGRFPAPPPAVTPLTLGEVALPITRFAFPAVLDDGGKLVLVFPGSVTPALLGIPVFGQAAMLDLATGQFRLSNVALHLFTF